MKKAIKWLAKNGLSLAFFALFAAALVGQTFTGWFAYDDQLAAHGLPAVRYSAYLKTGDFLEGIFCNWQAAILQLACLIFFAAFLRQKGASHSRKTTGSARKKKRHPRAFEKPSSWLYRNSLLLAFLVLFAFSFLAHLICGSWLYNETQKWSGHPPVSVVSYFCTADFWFRTVQTWQAEFVIIGVFLVLSVFLRQENSAESKPVGSADNETGATNE
ncbi:MAG TPA: DUF6766 family protein [Chthoniobacterales bacterium]|jgi:hypothetical protein